MLLAEIDFSSQFYDNNNNFIASVNGLSYDFKLYKNASCIQHVYDSKAFRQVFFNKTSLIVYTSKTDQIFYLGSNIKLCIDNELDLHFHYNALSIKAMHYYQRAISPPLDDDSDYYIYIDYLN